MPQCPINQKCPSPNDRVRRPVAPTRRDRATGLCNLQASHATRPHPVTFSPSRPPAGQSTPQQALCEPKARLRIGSSRKGVTCFDVCTTRPDVRGAGRRHGRLHRSARARHCRAAPRSDSAVCVPAVAVTGQQAPGTAAGTVYGRVDATLPEINAAGQVSFFSLLPGPTVDASNDRALFAGSPGTVAKVTREGTAPRAFRRTSSTASSDATAPPPQRRRDRGVRCQLGGA
jgi:hypothetical protein